MKKIILLAVMAFSCTSIFAQIDGVWKLAPQAGALGVGPAQGDIGWWSNSAGDVTTRDCLFDDQFVFGTDGSFMNIQDGMTWVEGWQGGADACAVPVAPHDGSNAATYTYDGSTIVLMGTGAHLGIPKASNGSELASPAAAPTSLTYLVSLSPSGTTMTLDIDSGGVWWRFILQKDIPPVTPVIEGTWMMAPQAAAMGVGPAQGDIGWWSNSTGDVTTRACFFDDEFIFGLDGSFMNVQDGSTWVEGWQGGADACAAPVAPHDGSNAATFVFDEMAGTITLNGVGAHLGVAKAVNGSELTSPASAPASVTYTVSFSPDAQTMTVDIGSGAAWWRYIMVKTAEAEPACSAPQNVNHALQGPAACAITWDAHPDALRYDVHYRVKGTTAWTRRGALNNYCTLHYLAPNTVYQYRVRSYCGTWDFANNATGFIEFNTANTPMRLGATGFETAITSIAPNPARDVLNVQFSTEMKSDVTFSVVDMMGKVISQNTIMNVEGLQNETIDVSNLGQGYYMLVMQSGERRVVEKFATVR